MNSSGDNLESPGAGQDSELDQAGVLPGWESWAGIGFHLHDRVDGVWPAQLLSWGLFPDT